MFGILLAVLIMRGAGAGAGRGLGLGVLAGLILFAGARAEFEGLARLQAAMLILLLFMAPIWVALIERALWGRRLTPRTGVAIVLVVGGVATMVGPPGGVDMLGVAFGVCSSILLAGFFVLIDRSRAHAPMAVGLSAALVAGGLAGVVLEPGGLATELGDPDVLPYALAVAASLAAWGVFAVFGLEAATAVTAAIISAAEPVFVALLAYLLLGEALSAREIAGGAIVMVGVLTASLAVPAPEPSRHELPRELIDEPL